jgi:hypothetical protein
MVIGKEIYEMMRNVSPTKRIIFSHNEARSPDVQLPCLKMEGEDIRHDIKTLGGW